MNIDRIIRVTSCYLFLTGYQIRWYDRKSLHYRLKICGILYILILILFYLICFSQHFENSSVLKMLLDISPFLKNLMRLQVLLCLKLFIFCMIGWKDLTKVLNGLVSIFEEHVKRQDSFDIWEAFVYFMFFFTLIVSSMFGLYIAIELQFELPPLKHIMIGIALFVPHFTLSGSLRLYTLGLWLIKRELFEMQTMLQERQVENVCKNLESCVVLEIVNPCLNKISNTKLYEFYAKISNRLEFIGDYLKKFDSILQRQLGALVGLNFNCLLAGVYTKVYFENTWNVFFTNRFRRVFYAANSGIFVCILVDYGILLITCCNFYRTKQNLYNFTEAQLFQNKPLAAEIERILKHMKHKLNKNFNLKLFGMVKFNTWNFLMLQGLTISIIVIIVSYQYLNGQIIELNDRFDVNDSE